MRKGAQILIVTIITLLILSTVAIIGISLFSSKEMQFSNFVSRGSSWISSVISSLEYGLYKLNMQNIVPEREITIPYFGEENLIPFFRAPFTITMYGEQVLPVNYEGYFGFRDLLYPITWIFRYIVQREAGEIKSVTVNPPSGTIQSQQLPARYLAYWDENGRIHCVPGAEDVDCTVTNILTDNNINTYILIGDDWDTSDRCEFYVLDIIFDNPKNVNGLEINGYTTAQGAKLDIFYLDTNSNIMVLAKSINVPSDFFYYYISDLKFYTTKIRIQTNYENPVDSGIWKLSKNLIKKAYGAATTTPLICAPYVYLSDVFVYGY